MKAIRQRARNAMLGLAIGDALSWPAMFHRSHLLPAWTRRVRREMNAHSEATNVLPIAMPFSLNQPVEHFAVGPTDDTEWATFTARLLMNDQRGFETALLHGWRELAKSNAVIKGGVSILAALNNLQKGIDPPHSGKQNPHYLDDGAIVRSIPIGVWCNGNSDKAGRLTAHEASVTNSEDGLWAAQSMAIAISLAVVGQEFDEWFENAVSVLPESSLVHRKVMRVMALSENCASLFTSLPKFQDEIVNREYSYGNAAPETLALAFAIAKVHGDSFERAMSVANAFPKCADSLPAIVGGLVGAMTDEPVASETWQEAIQSLKGICIPSLKGLDYLEQTDRFIEHAFQNSAANG